MATVAVSRDVRRDVIGSLIVADPGSVFHNILLTWLACTECPIEHFWDELEGKPDLITKCSYGCKSMQLASKIL